MWLIMVDATTKWPEVKALKTTNALATVTSLSAIFGRYGIPEVVVTDNGPQFVSDVFKRFCEPKIGSIPP